MTHDELKGLIPVLALDALPPEDEAEVVAHLKVCRECSQLLADHRETAGLLALVAGSRQAPQELRDRILTRVAGTTQPEKSSAPVRQSIPARRNWQWQRQWVGLAAACVLVLVAGGLAYLRVESQTETLNRQQVLIARQRQVLDLVSSPDAIVLSMVPAEASVAGEGKAYISDSRSSAAVVLSGMNDPRDEVYTLWLISEGGPKPVADFVPDDGLAVLPVDGKVGPDVTLAVTREPNRGNTSPQGPLIMAASRA